MNSIQKRAIGLAKSAAINAHRGQFRKNGTTPYIVHPERVAKRVKFYGGNYIGIISAWLHDVMEDCQNGEKIVRDTLKNSGLSQQDCDEIFSIVSALTKNNKYHDKMNKLTDSLNRIKHAPNQAILVKLCDRMDNLEDGKSQSDSFRSVYRQSTDQLIYSLTENATKNGYRDALEMLKVQRKTF
nr:HD domain-containing protein [uncultured Methanoregula sp.]